MKSITLAPDINELYSLNESILTEIPEEDFKVNLIAEEIFVNIVNYSKTEFITVNIEYNGSCLTLEFIDNGIEFNPLLRESGQRPDNINDAEIGGLGIFLTKKMADKLDYFYENGENHLIINKEISLKAK